MNLRPLPPARRPKRPRVHWLARLMRGWRLDRNPLRRRSDRAETAVLGVLLAAFLAGAPFAAHAAWSRAYTSSAGEGRAQLAVLHRVPATLLQATPSLSALQDDGALPDVDARWKAPDGQLRTGQVYVPDDGRAGSTVLIWVSPSGQQTGPPLQSGQIAGRADLAGVAAVLALAAVLAVAYGLTWRTLTARRLAGWDADWLATGPRWSPRR